jgi:hypothetical protein
MARLISNGSATASGVWQGGRGCFAVAGTFSGATVKLQVLLPDSATWADVGAATTLTAAGFGLFELPNSQIRALVSGGPPSGIYADVLATKG